MNRRHLAAILAAALALGGLGLTAPTAQAVVNVVPDAAFRACLNGPFYLNQAADAPITAEQLRNLESVMCDGGGIASLVGAEYLTSAGSLDVFNGRVRDLTPLAGLTSLTYLGLDNNQITDLAPLARLTNLENLSLANNPISDLTPLAGLTKLWYLGVGKWDPDPNSLVRNQLSDLSPLAGLTALSSLYLPGNEITTLAPLAGLVNLVALGVDGNRVADVTPLATLPKLSFIYLADNQITDITPLAGRARLESLDLRDNHVTDLSPLNRLMVSNNLWKADGTRWPPAVSALNQSVWLTVPTGTPTAFAQCAYRSSTAASRPEISTTRWHQAPPGSYTGTGKPLKMCRLRWIST